ncbi:MAG: DUF3143 domain-containing protein [Synechococcaceae cyanobacterium]|nr:DUF3143 domain-containing protein [Synechococcaceae cyanobacterium]
MTALPAAASPLCSHSLPQLETWLRQLGARQHPGEAESWDLEHPDWSARIVFQSEDLLVTWSAAGQERQRHFSYILTRADVEAAILAGP